MNFMLHHSLYYLIDLIAAHIKILQVLLIHRYVVQEREFINALLLQALNELTCHITNRIDKLVKISRIRLFERLDF